MDPYIGIVCGKCDGFNPVGAPRCVMCGTYITASQAGEPDAPPASVGAKPGSGTVDVGASSEGHSTSAASAAGQEEDMDQASYYVCTECSSPVPSGHKFCGACGGAVPDPVQHLSTDYFGAMQQPGKARLILIRGDQGVDGLSYLLQGTDHIAGRNDAQILFPEDAWLSPRHANFIYRGDKLVVRDEGSKNGVYVRVRGSVSLAVGDPFLCGEQIFKIMATPKDTSGPDPDQTYFYSSPKRPSPFRLVQVVAGGAEGMVFCARESSATIGREACDLNFPEDIYMSGNHAKIEMTGDTFTLTDEESRNGTYARIKGEQELGHGDYLFLGKQLLRVEMTA